MDENARKRPLILVVEDDIPAQRAFDQLLRDRGYRVVTADSADAAMTAALTQPPDLVICDWHLDRDDGVDLVRRLQGDFGCRAILITSEPLTSLRNAAADLRIEGFLRKPLLADRLIEIVERLAFDSANDA